ncbi:MAG: hypothetical protein LBR23_08580 [Spirochaetaceae bacterium]|nr:hypothetical protein [Spirochaetaceae bacterium]
MGNKTSRAFFCLASALAVLGGCTGESRAPKDTGDYLILTADAAPPPESSPGPSLGRYITDIPAPRRIAVFFGYGYNSEDFVSQALGCLGSLFADTAEEEVILPLVFPEDFKVGNTPRVSSLADKLAEADLAGIVLLGAPENTHRALGALRAKNTGPYPVVSLFPQDDLLGTEALSDMVLDFEIDGDLDAEAASERKLQEFQKDTPLLLARAVYYISLLDGPLAKNSDLYTHALQLAGPGWKVKPYIDAQTSMHPVNHFVMAKESHE